LENVISRLSILVFQDSSISQDTVDLSDCPVAATLEVIGGDGVLDRKVPAVVPPSVLNRLPAMDVA
jgi:hypothetical protein